MISQSGRHSIDGVSQNRKIPSTYNTGQAEEAEEA